MPDIAARHTIGEIAQYGEYYDDFCTIPLDVNGDGWIDFVTGGWWGDTIRWRENPGGPDVAWPEHIIARTGNIETARGWDVDGDGQVEIVPNTPGGPLIVYKLITDEQGRGTGRFESFCIHDAPQGHGLGFGDVNGDGRGDFVLAGGWLECPPEGLRGRWAFHPDFRLGSASAPIIVTDVNHDGLADIIAGQAHGYGLDWWEQRIALDGERFWVKHLIDPFNSQYHDMQWVDIDGDGEPELITGKRYRAHCGHDAGEFDDYGIYYFKWTGESFAKQVIDYGPPGEGKGCGIHFAVADLSGDGRPDIVAPGKDGLVLYENLG
jgi:hypothetical protein